MFCLERLVRRFHKTKNTYGLLDAEPKKTIKDLKLSQKLVHINLYRNMKLLVLYWCIQCGELKTKIR